MNVRTAKEEMALRVNYTPARPDSLRLAEQAHAATRPGLFARLVGWVRETARRQAAIAELSQLSDHELADIGLARGEIPYIFRPDFARIQEETRAVQTLRPLPALRRAA